MISSLVKQGDHLMDIDDGKKILGEHSLLGPIDSRKARFPCCIVWSPLPVISWFIPFVGHVGICREDGVILDFAGPNFVCVDHFTFGAATRYLQIDQEKCRLSPTPCEEKGKHDRDLVPNGVETVLTWDDAIKKSTQEFQHRGYSLFTCNCHSFVANNLNRMFYQGQNKWNVVSVCLLILFKGSWVDKVSIIKTLLPFLIVMGVGLYFGGLTFLICVMTLLFALVGWFLIGTYCFKDLIEL